ncbi:unnamed protein product, partial [Hapterophycus canaliculatus]
SIHDPPTSTPRTLSFRFVVSLHDMDEDAGLPRPEGLEGDGNSTAGTDDIKLPRVSNLSAERMSPEGVFLLENGVELLLWVGSAANPAVVSALFGVPSLDGVDLNRLQLQEEGNDLCRRVNSVIAALRQERMTYLQVRV